MKFEIDVIEENGKKKFCHAGAGREKITFDTLWAYGEFEGGKLSILRDGKVITTTTGIEISGPRNEEHFFVGLNRVFTKDGSHYDNPALFSNKGFRSGDKILLELPWVEEHDPSLQDFLISRHNLVAAFAQADKKRKVPFLHDEAFTEEVRQNLIVLVKGPPPTILTL